MSIPDDIRKIRTPETNLPVLDSIKKRFSPRVFSNEPVIGSDLEIILEAARLAPSGRNHEPWFFYIARKGTPEYEKLIGCVPERNLWVKTAPVILVACYDPTEPKDITNRWALHDLGAASMSVVLQATELGYHCRQIGSFDWDKAKAEFRISDPLIPFTLIAVGKMGFEDDYQKADPEIIKKELAPNPRKTKIFSPLLLR